MAETIRTLADSTLKRMTKIELIHYVRMKEENERSALQTVEQQYQNVKDWHPVKQGYWDKDDRCSCCRKYAIEDYHSPYCPWCGARNERREP